MKTKRIPINKMSHEEWLESRRKGIGGSDAAAIVGLSDWSTPYSIWADKTGRIPPKEDNEAMRQGRDLEEYVAKRFTEASGKKVRRLNAIITNDDYPFALANIDRDIVGENAGLECKTTTTLSMKKFKDREFPDNYYCQCMHYMAVTGADKWYLAVLVLGREFMWFEIPRDEDEINALMQAEENFWDYVVEDREPPVDGLRPTTNAIDDVYSDANESIPPMDLTMYIDSVEKMLLLKEEKRNVEDLIEMCEQEIKTALGDCSDGFIPDKYKISWKPQIRRTFQTKQFVKDHPSMDLSRYYKSSESRTFRVKAI